MSKRMVMLLALAVVVFGGLIGVKVFMNRMVNDYLDNMPIPPAVVSAAPAKADRWISQVTSVGTVSAIQGAELTTEVSGIVERIYFDNGSKVRAGDVILELDAATDQAEVKTLKAAERLAELERDRVQQLWKSKSVSKAEYDQRQSELEQAQARVAAGIARMEQKQLRAPHDGVLGIRRVNVGQYVTAGDPMISLQSLDTVFIDFSLPEQRYSDIRVGMTVTAQMDALGSDAFHGKITAIEPVIDADTRNFKVQATFANPEQVMRPGMFARLQMNVGEQRDVVTIPRSAISFKPYGNSVYVLTDAESKDEKGRPLMNVKQRFVTTGQMQGDLVVVEEGLLVGEQVATSGLLKLRSGGTAIINNDVQPEAEIAPTPDNG